MHVSSNRLKLWHQLFVLALGLLLLPTHSFFDAHTDSTSKTFLDDEGFFKNSTPIRMAFYDTLPDHADWHIQATLFGGSSTNCKDLARYFFPRSRNDLICNSDVDFYITSSPIASQNATITTMRDIDTTNFNLYTGNAFPEDEQIKNIYQGVIGINPVERYWGVGIWFSKGLSYPGDDDIIRWRFEMAAPIMEIVHEMNLKEFVKEPASSTYPLGLHDTPTVTTMTQALNQPAMEWGKILPCGSEMKNTGIGDIEAYVLYAGVASECCMCETYGGVIIPTGDKPGSSCSNYAGYLWQPIVGNGQHWGLELGNNVTVTLTENDERRLAWTLTATATYLFPNTQMRTFDLKDQSWGRYLSVWPNKAAMLESEDPMHQGDFGVNYLTFESLVAPRFSFLSTTLFTYTQDAFIGTVGLTAISRQAEHIDIKEDLLPIAIKGASSGTVIQDAEPAIGPAVSLARTVMYQFTAADAPNATDLPGTAADYYAKLQVLPGDIDKISAARPAILAGALSGSIGYQYECDESHLIFGLGGSYKFASNNALAKGWMAWLTLHGSF